MCYENKILLIEHTYIILIVVQIFLFLILNDGTTFTYNYSLVGHNLTQILQYLVFTYKWGYIAVLGNGEKNKAKLSNLESEFGSDLH